MRKSLTPAPVRKPTLASRTVRRIILAIWYIRGWKIDSPLPKHLKKYVIAGAPHTTNWDFVFFTGATHEEGIRPNFMGKHTLFKGLMRNFMFDMGGIPVDRTAKANATEQVAAEFTRRDELALVIAVEGSRTSDGKWRSGFYHIARAAGVPIVPAYADNANRVLGFGPPLLPTGNYGEDLLKIAEWFRSKLPDCDRFKVLEQQARDIIAGKNDV
ncbi:MAG: 1-acyl-sn-glycerol-3-phosphate acyltransferase [Allorhizobium sp.]